MAPDLGGTDATTDLLDADLHGVDGGGGGSGTVSAGFAELAGDRATFRVGAKSRGEGGGSGGAFLGGTFGFGPGPPALLPLSEALDRSRLGFTEGCIARSKSGKLGFEAD